MKSLLELYGQQFRNNPMLNSDSQDYTTADVFGQMGANKRRAEYDNSLLGMVHNWATGEQRQPVQLPDNAPLMDQMKEAGMRMLNLPNDMAAGGAKTMAHWLGSAGNPEMVEPLDMLAPLGIGAMAGVAGAMPRGAVGSAGGKLASEALDMSHEARMARAKETGFDTDTTWFHGTSGVFDEFSTDGRAGRPWAKGAVFFSDSPKTASGYAKSSAFADNIGKLIAEGGDTTKALVGGVDWLNHGSSIIPAKVNYGKQKTIRVGPEDNTDVVAGLIRDAKSEGYDTVRLVNNHDADPVGWGADGMPIFPDEMVVFDPSRIRSINAAFDPSKADSANLLAADQARGSIPGLAANALDMSHEARMARAKEMGFSDFTGYPDALAKTERLRLDSDAAYRAMGRAAPEIGGYGWDYDRALADAKYFHEARPTAGSQHKLDMLLAPGVAEAAAAYRAAQKPLRQMDRTLEMSDAVERMLDAAGKERQLDEGGRVYHGSPERFTTYDAGKARELNNSGGTRSGSEDVAFVSTGRGMAENFGQEVMDLDLKPGKYFDPASDYDLGQLAPYINGRPSPNDIWDYLLKTETNKTNWPWLESEPVVKELKRLGYDGVKMSGVTGTERGLKPHEFYGVFSRGQLTHADPGMNGATFFSDQSRASLPGLLAGAADEPTQDDELMRLLKLYGMMP